MSIIFGPGLGIGPRNTPPDTYSDAQSGDTNPAVIMLVSGQTGNLMEFRNAAGTVLSAVDASGNFTGGSVASAVILAPATSARNVIQPTADVIPLSVKLRAAQTADLLDFLDSTGAKIGGFDNTAGLLAANVSVKGGGVLAGDSTGGTSLALGSATVTPGADADYTLSASEASRVILSLATGAWAAAHSIIVPAGAPGAIYQVSNATGFTATVNPTSGAGIDVPSSAAMWLRSNGADMKAMAPPCDPSTGALRFGPTITGAPVGSPRGWFVGGDDTHTGFIFQAESAATPGSADVITEWRNHSGQQIVQIQDTGGFTSTVQINTKDVNDTALAVRGMAGQVASLFNVFTTGVAGFTIDVGPGTISLDGAITIGNNRNIAVGTANGTKIGTATTQKLGFFNATPVAQQTGASAAGIGAITDAAAKAAVQALQTALANLGFVTSPA